MSKGSLQEALIWQGQQKSVGPQAKGTSYKVCRRTVPSVQCPERLAECAICFEPLCEASVSFLRLCEIRVCRHAFHTSCISECPKQSGCPLCRSEYDDFVEVPDLTTSPAQWFKLVDMDGNGKLEKAEVLSVIPVCFPVDAEALEEAFPVLWEEWDINNDGYLSFTELLGTGGLLQHIHKNFQKKWAKANLERDQESLVLDYDKESWESWFEYWDTDRSGALEREEVVRGLIKSTGCANAKNRLKIRCLVERIWPGTDLDRNGRISFEEFCCPRIGLASKLLEHFSDFAHGKPASKMSKDSVCDSSQCAASMTTMKSGRPKSPTGGYPQKLQSGNPKSPRGHQSPKAPCSPRRKSSKTPASPRSSKTPTSPRRKTISPGAPTSPRRSPPRSKVSPRARRHTMGASSPRGGRRRSKGVPSPRRSSSLRPGSKDSTSKIKDECDASTAPLADSSKWNVDARLGAGPDTDIPESGDESPSLIRRVSKGFVDRSHSGVIDNSMETASFFSSPECPYRAPEVDVFITDTSYGSGCDIGSDPIGSDQIFITGSSLASDVGSHLEEFQGGAIHHSHSSRGGATSTYIERQEGWAAPFWNALGRCGSPSHSKAIKMKISSSEEKGGPTS